MIYTTDEIRQAITDLSNSGYDMGMNGRNLNRGVCERAADMMDDMLHALDVYAGLMPLLNCHMTLPSKAKECARFWNRERDKENTRIWDGTAK